MTQEIPQARYMFRDGLTWFVYGNFGSYMALLDDVVPDCTQCKYALRGTSSIFCNLLDAEVTDYRIAEDCDGFARD